MLDSVFPRASRYDTDWAEAHSLGENVLHFAESLCNVLPLRPGIVTYHPLLPPGTQRNTFLSIMSLMPGTLPSGPTEDGGIAIHCLDMAQPVAEQLAAEETLFVRAFGGAQNND